MRYARRSSGEEQLPIACRAMGASLVPVQVIKLGTPMVRVPLSGGEVTPRPLEPPSMRPWQAASSIVSVARSRRTSSNSPEVKSMREHAGSAASDYRLCLRVLCRYAFRSNNAGDIYDLTPASSLLLRTPW
jgi:hypothetical protein